MKKHEDELSSELSGQDSFLDIVANIVGILILLVVVVGVRASQYVKTGEVDPQSGNLSTKQLAETSELRLAFRELRSSHEDVEGLLKRVISVRQEAVLRDEERLLLNTLIAEIERELAQQRAEMDSQEQQDFDLRCQLNEAQRTLEQLTRQQVSLISSEPEVKELENLPTPLAKTVSGDEVHLRLASGRVSFIPLSELLQELKLHAEDNIWQLRDRDSYSGIVGPVDGYRLRYQMVKRLITRRRSDGGTLQGELVQLSRWELIPESDIRGEEIDTAVSADSELMRDLRSYKPAQTTVTVWTYPNSFADFRQLREVLFGLGYATAGRPLPQGIPIGGSPSGTKSAAQ